ncbi:MAG: hypothetical protein A2711_11325 [Burkholderiales bacterium RIFCSPHIGHO2_01_FULL_63_240]|nr:MAG: hypothetical protein A2711_11325 [Burkholderiales bacterium RIFCSPHIGHO2_01_FULL_63_240]
MLLTLPKAPQGQGHANIGFTGSVCGRPSAFSLSKFQGGGTCQPRLRDAQLGLSVSLPAACFDGIQ